jgi:hypothetical protein
LTSVCASLQEDKLDIKVVPMLERIKKEGGDGQRTTLDSVVLQVLVERV